MKKTENISLSGISFTIEKDALEKLKIYIDTLNSQFASQGEEGKEIIADIEARIGELLMSNMTTESQPITYNEVTKAIEQLGYPESDEETIIPPLRKIKRKLYRKKEGSILGGVFNGISSFSKIDVVWIRISIAILLALSFIFDYDNIISTIVLAYFCLWIIIPRASSVLQKLEMEGENINVSSIGSKYENYTSLSEVNVQPQLLVVIGKILKFLILTIVGFIFIILSLIFLSVLIGIIVIATNSDIITYVVEWQPITTFIAASILVIVPILLLILMFIQIMFSLKAHKLIYIIPIVLWFIAATFAPIVFFIELENTYRKDSISETIIERSTKNKLHVKILPNETNYSNYNSLLSDFTISERKKEKLRTISPEYYLRNSTDSTLKITLTRSAKGYDYDDAKAKASTIDMPYKIIEDTIFISSKFTLPEGIGIRGYEVKYNFYCPENYDLILDDKINYYNYYN